ncbi:MAG: DUF4349 domain-containing protein, partial [Demequina sp.]
VFIALAATLSACSVAGNDSTQSGGEPSVADFSEDSMAGGEATLAMEEDTDDGREMTADRSVIVTGDLYMTVEDPIAASDTAAGIVQNAGGRIDARRETAPDEYNGGSAWLTLRIPADRLDAVVNELRELGTVDEFSTSSYDVTTEVTDLEAQISTLRASTERIEALLAQAEDIEDIITLENELDRRQAKLESLEARQRGLDDQVSMSTIQLSLTTEPVVEIDDTPETFLDGLESGWNAMVAFGSGALVVIGVLLPWFTLFALMAAAIIVAVRVRQSRTRPTE